MQDDYKYKLSLFEAVLNTSQDGILVVDHESGKVRQFNSRFLEIWKIPQELANNGNDKDLQKFVLDQLANPPGFLSLIKDLYANPTKKSFDVLEFKDQRVFERHSEPLMIDGKIMGRVWYFRDVTEKIRNEALIIQSGKMATLGEMAGGIAHEINSPLAAIILNAEMLRHRSQSGPVPVEEIIKRVNSIIKTGQRISRIISGMKTFSRDTSDEEFQTFTVSRLVMDATDLCREKFRNHGVELRVHEAGLNHSVEGRFVQLSQVLINLLSNSFDAVQSLEEKWVEISGRITAQFFELDVIDSGPGIPKEVAKKMFQPFYTTKDVGAGTGLGLSISKGMIEAQGGKLLYDDSFGNTRFCIQLPCSSRPSTAPSGT